MSRFRRRRLKRRQTKTLGERSAGLRGARRSYLTLNRLSDNVGDVKTFQHTSAAALEVAPFRSS